MPFETAYDARIVGITSTGAGIDDDVDGGQLMVVMSKRFANQSLQLVASNGAADDAGCNRQSQARLSTTIGSNEDCEKRIGETSRILIDAVEVRFVMETLRRSKRPGERLQVTLRTRSKSDRGVRPIDACDPWRGDEQELADPNA
jgi:hypothetical protein